VGGAGRGGVPTLREALVVLPAVGLSESPASADPRRDKATSDTPVELLGEPLRVLASDIPMTL